MATDYFIGTSGWHYNHWRGSFYPPKLPGKDWLSYYSKHFNTVEINASFYRLPQSNTYLHWHQAVPSGFFFALKISRFITHIKRLKDCEGPLKTFTDRAGNLNGNIGPLLYQLPPGFQRDDSRLEEFLSTLDRLKKELRHVFEFRHNSWMNEEVFSLLRKHNAGFCIFDMPGFTAPVISTSDFAYIRFHGKDELYTSCYTESEMADWAHKVEMLSSDIKTIYIYFNNDAGGYALENAQTLRKLIDRKYTGVLYSI